MKSLFVVVLWLINATTGEVEQEQVASQPMTLEKCNETIEGKIVKAEDNQAVFLFCRKAEGKVST